MSALFSWVNSADTATLTVGDQVSSLPVANILDRKVQKVWRSGTSTSTYVGVDLGSAVSLGIIGLFGCTLSATDTVRIRLSNVAVGSSELLDTGALACGNAAGYEQYVYIPTNAISARYMRIDIAAASRASYGYFDIGRLWAGVAWTPTINYSLGFNEQWKDDSEQVKSPRSGAVFVDQRPVYRAMNIAFDWLSVADRLQALALDRVAGKRGQILFVPQTDGDLTTGPLLGRMVDTTPVKTEMNTSPAIYGKTYSLEQDL